VIASASEMLKESIDYIVYDLLSIKSAQMAESLHFFLYDTIKILLLLFAMIFFIGILRSYISMKNVKKYLSGKKKGVGNVLGALFGALTPFCSCSSIPIFIGFVEAGIPLGATFSFLITSPLINEYVAVIMFGFFGLKVTVLYILSGLLIGIFGGLILGKMNLEKNIIKDMKPLEVKENRFKNFKERINFGYNEAMSITKKVWLFVIIGVGIGAGIHGFVPQSFFQNIITGMGVFSVPLATLIGIPLYANCAGIIPVAVVLFDKGIPLGTVMAFLMSTAALSLPEAIILRRVMNTKLILLFFAIVSVGIVFIGYLLNLVV